MQRLNDVQIGESVEELLRLDLAAELAAVEGLREGIQHCMLVADFTTRGMFEEMLDEEETHVDYFETQLEAIRQVGVQHCLARQLKGS